MLPIVTVTHTYTHTTTISASTSTSATIPTSATTPAVSSDQDTPPRNPFENSTSESAIASTIATSSTRSSRNTISNGGSGTKDDPSSTPSAEVSGSFFSQMNSHSDSPNTQAPHQQGDPTSGSTEPSTAFPSDTPPVARNPNIGTIIGAVLGALALVVLIIYAVFCYRRQRKNNRDPPWKPAGRLTTVSGLCCWRRQRNINHAEGPYQRDDNVRAVSPYPLAGTDPGTTEEKRPGNVPLAVARQQAEDLEGEASEHQPVGQSGMDVYLSLDIMRRELQGVTVAVVENAAYWAAHWLASLQVSDTYLRVDLQQLKDRLYPLLTANGLPAGFNDNLFYPDGRLVERPARTVMDIPGAPTVLGNPNASVSETSQESPVETSDNHNVEMELEKKVEDKEVGATGSAPESLEIAQVGEPNE
ncbi:hypothetical protein PQX77_020542 [Marasmius sp. AFHP31]|nr:hypothetical protein PQX77_020542 [Marasmius sp. AFHP31]